MAVLGLSIPWVLPIGDRTGTRLRRLGGLAGGYTLAQATTWGDRKDPRGEDKMGGHDPALCGTVQW